MSIISSYISETTIIGFATIGFFLSWGRHLFQKDKLINAVTTGATSGNVPVGIILLLGAVHLLDMTDVVNIITKNWIMFWAGALLFGLGLSAIVHNE